MFPTQIPRTDPDEFLRCGDAGNVIADAENSPSKSMKADVALTHAVDHALWEDGILRAVDYNSIEIHVKSGIVSLYGHVVSLTNQHQAENILRSVDGILGIRNHLIPDDRLVSEVAAALGSLEHARDCKFYTGVSHGVVLLSGTVGDTNTKLLAEKCAAGNPNVRAVISSVHVRGSALDSPDQPFLQPSIGAEIFFLDGISGRVRQVVINPDNRRVLAMTVEGRFADPRELKSLINAEARPSERILVLPMKTVRHLTKGSGFVNIRSNDREGSMDFDPAHFITPKKGWTPPYPYCPDDVLFPVERQQVETQVSIQLPGSVITGGSEDQSLREQLLGNDSLGG